MVEAITSRLCPVVRILIYSSRYGKPVNLIKSIKKLKNAINLSEKQAG
jgi:hypothetical protein